MGERAELGTQSRPWRNYFQKKTSPTTGCISQFQICPSRSGNLVLGKCFQSTLPSTAIQKVKVAQSLDVRQLTEGYGFRMLANETSKFQAVILDVLI